MKNWCELSRLFALTLTLYISAPASVSAQDSYPAQPVRLVVPFTAGGGVDLTAREIGARLERALGQPVVVENRPGAGGMLGVRTVISAKPDGYTLLLSTAGEIAMTPILTPDESYQPQRDLAPVALVVKAPNVMVVNSSVPVTTIQELIEYAKANPGRLSYSTSGVGTAQHLAGEYFNSLNKVDVLHIPYKGSAQQVTDVVGKNVSMTYASPAAVRPYLEKGQLRALGVTTDKRLTAMPDIPAIGETVPGYELQSWFALFAPADTPKPIVDRLNKEVVEILRDPELSQKLSALVGEPSFETPEEFSAMLKRDIEKFNSIISDAGITVKN